MTEITTFDPLYPPRQRTCREDLSAIQIAIASKEREQIMDANEAAMRSYQGCLDLGEPLCVSCLSGEPAYRYASSEVSLGLSHDELYRLMRLDLTAHEYTALRTQYGIFYEIHDDFYDPETGFALQPRRPDADAIDTVSSPKI